VDIACSRWGYILFAMKNVIDRAPADIYDNSGKLLLAKGHEITPAALRRLKKYIQYPELASVNTTEIFNDKEYKKEICSNKFYTITELPGFDLSGLRHKLPDADPELLSYAASCLDDCYAKVKNNDLLYINLQGLARYVDWVYSHSINVALLTIMIARQLNLVSLAGIAMGALFHDLGKVLIPKEIINKQAALTDEEFALIKQHSRLGRDMLSEPGIDYVIPMIAGLHHERLDGQGYPFGLHRGQIHIYAQIVGLADTFDAITSQRPYRPACSPEDALIAINNGANSKFSPALIKACTEIVKGKS